MSAFCPHCGAAVQDRARFCPGCGQALEQREDRAAVPPFMPAAATGAAAGGVAVPGAWPSPAARSRGRPWGRIALAVVALLIVGVIAAITITAGPRDVVSEYLAALAARDDAKAYALTSAAFREVSPQASMTAFADATPAMRAGGATIVDTTVSGSSAVVVAEVLTSSGTVTIDFELSNADGSWRISGLRVRPLGGTQAPAPTVAATAAPAAAPAATAAPKATAAPTVATGPRAISVDTTLDIPRPVAFIAASGGSHRVFAIGDNSLVIVNGSQGRVDTTSGVATGMTPVGMAVDGVNERVYYAYERSGSWYIEMRGASTGYVAPATTDSQSWRIKAIAVDPKTGRLFQLYDRVLGINKADLSGGGTQVAVGGVAIAVNERTGEAYVSSGTGKITVIDASGGVGKSFDVGLPVTTIAVDPSSGLLYALAPGTRSVVVVSVSAGQMDGIITVPATPTDVKVSPTTGRVYVSTVEGVVGIDAKTRTVVSRATISGQPSALAIDDGRIYVAQKGATTITVLRD